MTASNQTSKLPYFKWYHQREIYEDMENIEIRNGRYFKIFNSLKFDYEVGLKYLHSRFVIKNLNKNFDDSIFVCTFKNFTEKFLSDEFKINKSKIFYLISKDLNQKKNSINFFFNFFFRLAP